MSKSTIGRWLYCNKKCSIAFLIAGIGFMVTPIAGVILICFDCTLGIYLMYKNYKRILSLYS